jgi:hypothetical protein
MGQMKTDLVHPSFADGLRSVEEPGFDSLWRFNGNLAWKSHGWSMRVNSS